MPITCKHHLHHYKSDYNVFVKPIGNQYNYMIKSKIYQMSKAGGKYMYYNMKNNWECKTLYHHLQDVNVKFQTVNVRVHSYGIV